MWHDNDRTHGPQSGRTFGGYFTNIMLAGAAGALLSLAIKRSVVAAWTVADLIRQFDRTEQRGWLPYFSEAAKKYNFDQDVLMAIASRETNIQNILGDGGHGHGIMQIDDRSYPDFCNSDDWKDPRKNILKGGEVLNSKRKDISDSVGRRNECKGNRFQGLTLSDLGLLRSSIAAYNCGCRAYYAICVYGNPDRSTTGGDYSADVINRAEVFNRLL